MLFKYCTGRCRQRLRSVPSFLVSGIAELYIGARSVLITRGWGWDRSLSALRNSRLAASASRNADSRKSMVCASPQSKTHQEQCILKSSLISGPNFSVALNARPAGLLRNRLNGRTLLSWAQTNESLRAADSSSPVIAVMQPAHALLLANHCTLFQRACPTSRRLLVQPEVGSVVVIIGNVLRQESLQMSLIQRDYVVEQVAAAASDPTFGDPILPGTPNRGTDRCHVQRTDRLWHFQSVLRIVVE